MTLDPAAALHTLALFLGSLGGRCKVRVVLGAEDASVLLITPGSAPLVERAAALLGVQARGKCRDSDLYPVEYVAAGCWHGLPVTVTTLFSPEEWAAFDVGSTGRGAA